MATETQAGSSIQHTGDGGVKVAFITSGASIITAFVTALLAFFAATRSSERSASEAAVSAADAQITSQTVASLAQKVEAIAAQARCPVPITEDNIASVVTYVDEFPVGAATATHRELVNRTGSGCLIGGAILGYYFRNPATSENYTIRIKVDDAEFDYPLRAMNGANAHAYAQDAAANNTGVLVLPSIAFAKSLRIQYDYVGFPEEGKHLAYSAYAMVLPFETSEAR